jgi:hypothetical protein
VSVATPSVIDSSSSSVIAVLRFRYGNGRL